MRAIAVRFATVAVLALLTACDAALPSWCEAPPGVRTVVAGAPTRWRTPPRMVPLWEVHGDGAGAVFGNPNAVALHPTTGVLAVADHASSTVTLIGPDGAWLHRHAAAGRGTGELSLPAALHWLADGRLAVLDIDNQKLLFLNARGAFAGERELGVAARGWHELPGPALQGDVVLATGRRRVVELAPGRPNAEPGARPWVELVATRIAWGSGRAETLLQRRVRASAEDGATLPLSPAESLEVRDVGAQAAPGDLARVARVFTSGDGRIWVQRDRAAGPLLADYWFGPPGAAFDVFAADGAYMGEVRAPADVRLVAARGDTVLALRGVAGGESVVAYLLQRSP